MRRKLVAGNWKMNKTVAETAATLEALLHATRLKPDVEVVVCPSYLSIPKASELLRNTQIALGAQDVFWKELGAFTGKVSPTMLVDLGVQYCIVGHSETRGRFGKSEVEESVIDYFAETDETVNCKIQALLYHSIRPILCVGETFDEREAGLTDSVIQAQLDRALKDLEGDELYDLVVAYEPVWAIGTGKICDAAEAGRVCEMIRNTLSQLKGISAAEHTRVLYGGSLKSSNAGEIFHQPEIDGGLVGGASLDPQEFGLIVVNA